MRYSAMPMRVPLFHSLAELMATMMRYYCHGEVPEAMLPALAASNGLASFVQLGLQYHRFLLTKQRFRQSNRLSLSCQDEWVTLNWITPADSSLQVIVPTNVFR